MKAVHLANGTSIPEIGLGLWKITNQAQFDVAFEAAVAAGYRHFDSAQIYGNEDMLGAAIAKSGLPRSEFFITTKIHVLNFGAKRALKSFEKSLEKLQTDYLDLLLLHFPVTGLRKSTWKALEQLHGEGKVRNIGVSNYTVKHLEGMKKYATMTPKVNQVELHVFLQQPELVEYCKREGIVVEAYSPLAHAKAMDSDVIARIGEKHGKSYAQVMLRWCLQNEFVILPKSVTPSRIRENIAVYDFALDDDDMKQLATLDKNLRTCWDPTLVP
jgi:diketogulonate reductase-like aldo/keto reductase